MKESEIVGNIRKFVSPTDVLAVAVSGGMDSMVLLHAVMNSDVLDKNSYFVVNIEHGIRGDASMADSRFVEDYCRKNGILFRNFPVDAKTYSLHNGLTLEEGARALRYGVFSSLLKSGECTKLALAHHRADQAETVLMRIIRGTGVQGLQGMKDSTQGYIRPLLNVSKKAIEDYAAENGVPYVTDESNFDNAYTRNRLRNEILPALGTLSQDAEGALIRLSRLAAETEDFISEFDNPVEVGADYSAMTLIENEHPLLFKRRVRKCFQAIGVMQDVEERHVSLICELISLENGASLDMPYEVKVTKEYDKIVFSKTQQKADLTLPFSVGKTTIGQTTVVISKNEGNAFCNGQLIIDIAKIPKDAVLRTRRAGDRFTKFGGGTKSLGDYLTDKKIPLRLRDNLVLCAVGNDVLFIVGVEICDGVKVDGESKKENVYKVTTED